MKFYKVEISVPVSKLKQLIPACLHKFIVTFASSCRVE